MRILILGGTGMLGHKLWQRYQGRFDTWATTRHDYGRYHKYGLYKRERLLGAVDAVDLDSVVRALAMTQPDVVVNCAGVIKQVPAAKDPLISLTTNSLFPHRLANLCQATGTRLIHISTDCVFSGRKGNYIETDVSDAEDLYGRSKYLGEIDEPGCLTLRTSIIGRELSSSHGLVEWFLGNRGAMVRGYTRSIFSGFTTIALADAIARIIEGGIPANGLYHLSSEPIAKYDLLCLLNDAFGADAIIEPDATVEIDRSLNSERFRALTGFVPPSWEEMVKELAEDPTPYDLWRRRE